MSITKRGNIWWITRTVNGKRIRVSTGTSDEAEARRKEQEIVTLASIRNDADRLKMVGMMVASKEETADEMEKNAILISECLEKYPHVRKDGSPVKKMTQRSVGIAWRKFTNYCSGIGITMISQVTEKIASDFIMSCKPGMKDLCFIYCRATINRIGIKPNPFAVRPVKKPSEHVHREPLTVKEIEILLKAVDSYRAHMVHSKNWNKEFSSYIRFLLYTGLRMGDAALMKVSSIDFETMTISRMRTTKTDALVSFPLHKSLVDIIPHTGEYLFPSIAESYLSDNGDSLSHRVKHLFELAGLTEGYKNGERCCHCLRTTFATLCCEALVPIEVIQSWLGHESVFITYIYAHFRDMEKKKEAISRLPSF